MGVEFPSKPMSLYATIWDASSWATDGGKYKVDYRYQPFVAEFKELSLEGCPVDPILRLPAPDCSSRVLETRDYANITPAQLNAMRVFRQRHMYYSYCYDAVRYPVPPPECVIVASEQEIFKDNGRLKVPSGGRRKRKRPTSGGSTARAE